MQTDEEKHRSRVKAAAKDFLRCSSPENFDALAMVLKAYELYARSHWWLMPPEEE